MAYKTSELFETATQAIANNFTVVFIDDIVSYLPCDKATFYRHFPKDCDKYNSLKKGVEENKIRLKEKLRKKMYKSKSVAAWIALYRLIGEADDRRALSQRHFEHTIPQQEIKGITFNECECKNKQP